MRLSELSPTALEVYHLGRWGPIAGPFTGLGALVACQQLGYPSGRAVAASLPPGAPMPAAADVTCSGREASLAECQGTEYVAEEPPATVAGVMCGNDTGAQPLAGQGAAWWGWMRAAAGEAVLPGLAVLVLWPVGLHGARRQCTTANLLAHPQTRCPTTKCA